MMACNTSKLHWDLHSLQGKQWVNKYVSSRLLHSRICYRFCLGRNWFQLFYSMQIPTKAILSCCQIRLVILRYSNIWLVHLHSLIKFLSVTYPWSLIHIESGKGLYTQSFEPMLTKCHEAIWSRWATEILLGDEWHAVVKNKVCPR